MIVSSSFTLLSVVILAFAVSFFLLLFPHSTWFPLHFNSGLSLWENSLPSQCSTVWK